MVKPRNDCLTDLCQRNYDGFFRRGIERSAYGTELESLRDFERIDVDLYNPATDAKLPRTTIRKRGFAAKRHAKIVAG